MTAKKKTTIHNRRGIALLLAIIITSIIISVTLNLTVIAVGELSLSRISRDSTSARYAAESGLECAIYWLFQGEEYFSDEAGSEIDISCNNETFEIGGTALSTIKLNDGLGQYGEVTVEKTDSDYRNFSIIAEGFNADPIIIPESQIVEQTLEAVTNEICSFDSEFEDSVGNSGGTITISSSNLQNTLNNAYDPNVGDSNYINASTDNTGYQTWSIGGYDGNVVVNLQVTPLESDALYANTFGFYLNNEDSPYLNWTEINADNAFNPVFANKSNIWDAPLLNENPSAAPPWQSFAISANSGDVIAFAIHSKNGGNTYFRSTEKSVNGGSSGAGVTLEIHGQCIMPVAGSMSNGTRLTLSACDGSPSQEWLQEGVHWRSAVNTNQVIDLSASNHPNVQIWAYWNGVNQRWNTVDNGGGVYQIDNQSATSPTWCIEPEDFGGGNNNLVVAACDTANTDQQISIVPTGNTVGPNQYALTYDIPEPIVDLNIPEYVLAFEDQDLVQYTPDYDDMVVVVRVISCSTSLNRN